MLGLPTSSGPFSPTCILGSEDSLPVLLVFPFPHCLQPECRHLSCLLLFSRQVVSDSAVTPWTAARKASLFPCIAWSLLKFMSIASVMPSNRLCRPFLLLPSIFPSIRVFPVSLLFTSGGQSISFSISPSNK